MVDSCNSSKCAQCKSFKMELGTFYRFITVLAVGSMLVKKSLVCNDILDYYAHEFR